MTASSQGSAITVLDRIAALLGYVRPTAGQLHTESTPVTPPVPHSAHRVDREKFDYTKAKHRLWGFGYNEGDEFCFALGKDDWMPMSVACALLAPAGEEIIEQGLSHAWWLPSSSPRYQDWVRSNRQVLDFIQNSRTMELDLPASHQFDETQVKDFGKNAFALMQKRELGHYFEYLFHVTYPKNAGTVLCSSDIGVLLEKTPLMTSLRSSIEAAIPQFLAWAADWFEARAIEVDRSAELVKFPGYQPMFLVEEQSY